MYTAPTLQAGAQGLGKWLVDLEWLPCSELQLISQGQVKAVQEQQVLISGCR